MTHVIEDEAAFAAITEPHRRELQIHCYRMLGNLDEAEDLTQETLLRAWRKRDSYAGRATVRAWLYRIATNACLDHLESAQGRTAHQLGESSSAAEVLWLQPIPDLLLDEAEEPDAQIVAKETIELAFLAAIQHLPPQQRAVLILRDVLGWSANDTAGLLDTSVAAANSALQRSRETLKRHLPARRDDWRPAEEPTADERELLERYMAAHHDHDAQAIVAMLDEQARFTMPPDPTQYDGLEEMTRFLEEAVGGHRWRCVETRANRQPAVACYVRREGDDRFRPLALDVLRFEDGRLAEITAFHPDRFPLFGLPETLPDA